MEDHLQYGRRQYGRVQYGKYNLSRPGPGDQEQATFRFKKARLKAYHKDGQSSWVYQHDPVTLKGRPRQLRLSANTGETVYTRQVTFPGYHPTVRLKTPTTTYISEHP